MSRVVFIGDEVSAAGYRLAGAIAYVPAAGEESEVLDAARRDAALVLVSAECAARVPAAQMVEALSALKPLVLVVPDARGRVVPPDLGRLVRKQLGMEA